MITQNPDGITNGLAALANPFVGSSGDFTDKEVEEFIEKLTQSQGTTGNKSLREQLGWSDTKFWAVKNKLLFEGKIKNGMGRGGSTILIKKADSEQPDRKTAEPANESSLYQPLVTTLETAWLKDFALDDFKVVGTAMQGARETGGMWTRPDITFVSIQTYAYIPGKIFEVSTIEVKHKKAFDVKGLFEALSHNRNAHKSYAFYHIDADTSDEDKLRITDEARRLGVGLLFFEDPRNAETWELLIKPDRREPDPENLNTFINNQLDDETKQQILKWLK